MTKYDDMTYEELLELLIELNDIHQQDSKPEFYLGHVIILVSLAFIFFFVGWMGWPQ